MDNISVLMTSLVQGFREMLLHPVGFMQIGTVGATYLIAMLFAGKVRQHLEKGIGKAETRSRFVLSPAQLATVLKYFFWLVLLWFCQTLFKLLKIPFDVLHLAVYFVAVLLIVRFVSYYIKSIFWSRFVYVFCLVVVSLRIFKLLDPAVRLLSSMTISLGKISISMWGLTESIIVFILLWTVAGTANRFIAHWLKTSSKLTYSDRTLLQRVIKATTTVVVFLVTLRAAGIHMTAIAVTGGAVGLGIGVGLQKLGSNLLSGIMLLVSKPIRQGDVIAFDKSYAGANYGWITQIGLMYVGVATRNGSLLLIPNEVFVTQQIENLSFNNNLVRVDIPFGIAYESDLNKAKTLALSSITDIARILKDPEPKCLVMEYGDSTVNLELRVWINDPKNGIDLITDAVLMAVWDSFHANGIQIAFPQRDLHIKSAVPLKIFKDTPQAVGKDPPANEG
jgi:small-conductance mechanosensitive channel